MQNINSFIARKLITQTNILTNIEHRIKKHTKALVPPKTHQLATIKRELQNTDTKKLNQEAKAKSKPIKLHFFKNHQTNQVVFSYSNN
jgi:hypothetical protein